MAYPSDEVVRTWLEALQGLNVRVRKMFGCYCLYCDDQPVDWLSGEVLSLREVGLPDLPADLERPAPGDKIQEIPIPLGYSRCAWLPCAVQETANRRKSK